MNKINKTITQFVLRLKRLDLDEREIQVLIGRLQGISLRQIALSLPNKAGTIDHVSSERVRGIETKALRRLFASNRWGHVKKWRQVEVRRKTDELRKEIFHDIYANLVSYLKIIATEREVDKSKNELRKEVN